MVYMGSKNRIAKDIIKKMEPYFSPDKMYYEPFVGGANMIDKIPKDKVKGLVGNDYNEYLIALLNHVKHNEIEYKFIEKEDWYENYLYPFRENGEIIIKEKKLEPWEIGYLGFTKTYNGLFMMTYSGLENGVRDRQIEKHNSLMKQRESFIERKLEPWEIGYLGFTKSFSGIFMHSYAGERTDRKLSHQEQRHKAIMKQSQQIKEIEFIHGCYTKMQIEDNSIVYVDGPYKDTTKYKDDIDHDELYDWCRDLVNNKNCIVFVSEYQMPPDFKCIWEKELKAGLGGKKQTEKLFMLK